MNGTYWDLFDSLHKDLSVYFFNWYFDRPMVISKERDMELHRVQQLLAKCLHFYADHYEEYLDLIPYDEKILHILDMVKDKKYVLGTFRPDYIIGADGRIQICEITSRFFGNGYFLSFFADKKGRELAKASGYEVRDDRMESMLAYYARMADGFSRISVVKSSDKSDSIRLYVPFYRALGKPIRVFEYDEISANIDWIKDSLILSALNQKDILTMPDDILEVMTQTARYNDFRTVFLAHDKRLFSLFFMDSFTDRFLGKDDTAFLRDHVIPTYIYGQNDAVWEDARLNKNSYIIKHHCLGKSERVYAGCMTDENEWQAQWDSGAVREMILQPFITQRCTPNVWHGQSFMEYIAGTILSVDEEYFGTGLFRSSSLPVLNKGDDRKVGIVLADEPQDYPGECLIL